MHIYRTSPPDVFLGKGVLKLVFNFIEITLHHECSPVNLLHIFRAPFPYNTSGGPLLSGGLTFECMMPQNGHTNFKSIAVNTA